MESQTVEERMNGEVPEEGSEALMSYTMEGNYEESSPKDTRSDSASGGSRAGEETGDGDRMGSGGEEKREGTKDGDTSEESTDKTASTSQPLQDKVSDDRGTGKRKGIGCCGRAFRKSRDMENAESMIGKEGATKEKGDEIMTFREKIIRTACAQAAYLAVTLNLGMIGPSMLDLEMLTHSSTQEMSTVFTWRAVLGLVASLVLGPLLDHVNKFFVVGVALASDVIFIAAAPWTTHIAALLATMAPPEFFNSAIGMGTHLICISLWGADAGPSLQALNLMATIGYMLGPLLCKPFLAPSPAMQASYHNYSQTRSVWNLSLENGAHQEFTYSNASLPVKPIETTFTVSNKSVAEDRPLHESTTNIQYAYLIVAIYDVLVAIFILGIFVKDGGRIKLPISEKESGEEIVTKKRSRQFVINICILFFLFNVFYGGIEVGYAGLLMTFAVKYLGWSKADGTNVTAVLQASNAIVTAAAIFISRWVRAQTMLLWCIGIVTAAMLILSLTVEHSHMTLWLCTACLGVGYATIMPCSYTWVNDTMNVTGKFSSAYWAGFFTGFMLVPAIAGQLFYHVHPMWMPYVTLICSFGMLVFFIIISVVIWHDNRKIKRNNKD